MEKKKLLNGASENQYQKFVKMAELTNDYMKHIATLNIGMIVFFAAFLQKNNPYVVFSIVFSLVSIACSIRCQEYLIDYLQDSMYSIDKIPVRKDLRFYNIVRLSVYITFLLAIFTIIGFVFSSPA